MSPDAPRLDILFFDVDDTLYSTTAFADEARGAAIRAMIDAGLQVGYEEGVGELAEVVAEFASNYDGHLDRLLDRLGPEASASRNRAVLVAAGVVAYHRMKAKGLAVLEDARAVLESLHAAGVRLGVISAGLQVKQAEKLIRLDVVHHFDPGAIYFSDQVGVSKPNPKLFSKVCAHAGVEPARAMYIGDRPGHDIAPAGSIGMPTVHYTGAGGKYGGETCVPAADYTIADMRLLLDILREDYALPV